MASNNNSQKFNSKFGGVSAKKSSSVDTDQLMKLKENNHMEWEKILDLYFTAQDPTIGTFLTPQADGTPQGYQKRPPLRTTEEWSDLHAEELKFLHKEDIKKLRMKEWEEYTQLLNSDTEKYKKWYALILRTLSTRQLEELAKSQDWIQVNQDKMPLELVQLIKARLVWRVQGLPDTQAQDALLDKFNTCVQADREDITDYCRRLKTIYNCLMAANHPQAGDNRSLVRKAVRGLSARYSAFKADTLNRDMRGETAAYPDDVMRVAELARMFAGPHYSTPGTKTITAMTCSVCKRENHDESSCWLKNPHLAPSRFKRNDKKCETGAEDHNKKKKNSKRGKPQKTAKQLAAHATSVVKGSTTESTEINSLWGFGGEGTGY
jgi:hypothetical protein